MLKPKHSFQAVVSELIEGLRTGAIKLRDEPKGANAVPGVPVSGSMGGGAGAASGRPLTGDEVAMREPEAPRQRKS